jgi:hypothetical protein
VTYFVRATPDGPGRVKGPCPFCLVGEIDCDFTGGGSIDGHPALVHTEPTCDAFDRMTADEFVQAVLDGKHRR